MLSKDGSSKLVILNEHNKYIQNMGFTLTVINCGINYLVY